MFRALLSGSLLLLTFIYPYWSLPEEGYLVLSVTNTAGEPIDNIAITCTGDCAEASSVKGRVRLKLPPQTRSGEWVTLKIVNRSDSDWVLISPWDSRVLIPSFDNKADNAIPVVVARRGDKEILSSSKALEAIAKRVLTEVTPKLNEISVEERNKVLEQQAKAVGLTPAEVDQAIREWKERATDPDQRQLAERYVNEIPRWDVRAGEDPDAAAIDTTPKLVTVEQMVKFERPLELQTNKRQAGDTKRYPPVETSVYIIEAQLIAYRIFEQSGDLRLILRGSSGSTMGAVIPDPEELRSENRFAKRIATARATVLKHFDIPKDDITSGFEKANVRVRVTGIGYFNYPHAQLLAAPNVIELHPVLDIEFIKN